MIEKRFQLDTFPVGPLQCNCTILSDLERGEAIIIDPGDEPETIVSKVKGAGVSVKAILHTHAHIDHIFATAEVKAEVEGEVYLHKDDLFLYQMLSQQAEMIGLMIPEYQKGERQPVPVDAYLKDKEELDFISWGGEVLHTPGHTPGSLSFFFPSLGILFSGDTLFMRSIGRTDLPGGDFQQIMASICERLLPLPLSTKVIPGHGPATTLAQEKRGNPFILQYGM